MSSSKGFPAVAVAVVMLCAFGGASLLTTARAEEDTTITPGALSIMSGALNLAARQELGLLPLWPRELGEVGPPTTASTVPFRPVSINITNSPEQDAETQVLTTSAGGTEYTVVTHMRFSGGAWHMRYIKLAGVTTVATGEMTIARGLQQRH
jgi:hypothetical protein